MRSVKNILVPFKKMDNLEVLKSKNNIASLRESWTWEVGGYQSYEAPEYQSGL
ncbi:hypothetical protein [Lacrimispora sp.]|uniref:hypothetical protein n=1 Tax=Lacrimispora sp. TaxID=2719234 RepID=UPI00399577EB